MQLTTGLHLVNKIEWNWITGMKQSTTLKYIKVEWRKPQTLQWGKPKTALLLFHDSLAFQQHLQQTVFTFHCVIRSSQNYII